MIIITRDIMFLSCKKYGARDKTRSGLEPSPCALYSEFLPKVSYLGKRLVTICKTEYFSNDICPFAKFKILFTLN